MDVPEPVGNGSTTASGAKAAASLAQGRVGGVVPRVRESREVFVTRVGKMKRDQEWETYKRQFGLFKKCKVVERGDVDVFGFSVVVKKEEQKEKKGKEMPLVEKKEEKRKEMPLVVPLDGKGYLMMQERKPKERLLGYEERILGRVSDELAKLDVHFRLYKPVPPPRQYFAGSVRDTRAPSRVQGRISINHFSHWKAAHPPAADKNLWVDLSEQAQYVLAYLHSALLDKWPGTLEEFYLGVRQNRKFERLAADRQAEYQADEEIEAPLRRMAYERNARWHARRMLREDNHRQWTEGIDQNQLEMEIRGYQAWDAEMRVVAAMAKEREDKEKKEKEEEEKKKEMERERMTAWLVQTERKDAEEREAKRVKAEEEENERRVEEEENARRAEEEENARRISVPELTDGETPRTSRENSEELDRGREEERRDGVLMTMADANAETVRARPAAMEMEQRIGLYDYLKMRLRDAR